MAATAKLRERTLLAHLPGVVGIDEAGRGPLAGPVVAAAVVLPAEFDCVGIHDSKILTPEQRNDAELRITDQGHWHIGVAHADEIDAINILGATFAAMERAFNGLAGPVERVLIDGNQIPFGLRGIAEAVVKGDGTYACIAAASILAKSARDRMMVGYAKLYPEYGFERHFGYATPEHLAALERFGPCPIHRRSFRPIRPEAQTSFDFEP